jgi:hypothetical protein
LEKRKYDENGNLVYEENSEYGVIVDRRNIIVINGKKYKLMEE